MKLVREHINEKFIENSDPIEDLGIGLRGRLKIEYDIIENKPMSELGEYFFGDKLLLVASKCIREIIKISLKEDKNKLNDSYFSEIFNNYIHQYGNLSKYGIKIIKEYFKEKFNIELKYKTINEKFTEDSDPIRDLGIGGINLHKKYLEIIPEKYRNIQFNPNIDSHKKWYDFLVDLLVGHRVKIKRVYNEGEIVVVDVERLSLQNVHALFLYLKNEPGHNYMVDLNYRIFIEE